MTMRKKMVLAALCLCAACNNAPVANAPGAATAETDTINYALNSDSVKLSLGTAKPPEGFYGVTLPCTDCKGIEQTVLFKPDLSYRLEELVTGTQTITDASSGAWKLADNQVWLYEDSSVRAHYTWHGDTLLYNDPKSGVLIPLRKLPGAMENTTWVAKKRAGLKFFGVGTEPFWNISIDEQKGLSLAMPDWPAPKTFKAVKGIAAGDSLLYLTNNDSARLRVVVYKRFGYDGMSGKVYGNTVRLVYKGRVYTGAGELFK